MFIELHMIQNFAPSNLNRDDTNNPKDCEFGGHRRARISSQSLKRAIRFEPIFVETTKVPVGKRTKWMTRPLKKQLQASGHNEEDATIVATAFADSYAGKMDKNKAEKTSVLLYLSTQELQLIASTLLENWDEALAEAKEESKGSVFKDLVKVIIKETKERTSAPDIALFGRMLADKPELNIDAACQVAHAISTHRVNMEMDFYTAVDDFPGEDSEEGSGAAMMGFTSFNAACFYRYARLDWRQLVRNLDGNKELARQTVEGFLRAALDAIPTGKQNSFAAQNPTSLALAVVREDGKSWNLANAFETPVYARTNTGLIAPSIKALDTYWHDITSRRDDASLQAVAVWTDQSAHQQTLSALTDNHCHKLSDWIAVVNNALPASEEA